MTSTIKHSFLIIFIVSLTVSGQDNFSFKKILDNHKHFEERELNISIYKNGGELYYLKKLLPPNFSIPNVALFENGNFALIHSLEGLIEFYTAGVLQSQKELLGNKFYNESSILFSANKNKMALLITKEQKNKIILLDDFGNVIFEKQAQNGFGSGVSYSEEANMLVVSINNWERGKLISNSTFTNFNTGLEFTIPHKFEYGVIEKDSSTFLGHSNNKIFLVDINSKKLLWTKKSKSNSFFARSKIKGNNVFIIEAKNPILVNNSWEYEKAEIVTFGRSGEKLKSQLIEMKFKSIDLLEDNEILFIKVNSKQININ